MTDSSLILPPPTSSVTVLQDACRSVYEGRDHLIENLDLGPAQELRRQSAAIEVYLQGTEAYPDAQRAARILEMAVGRASGKRSKGGRGRKLSSELDGLSANELVWYRALHDGRARIEPYLEDDEEGRAQGLSREAALRVARGLARAYSSDDDEWYSPAMFVEAARSVMEAIDLDPCSSTTANEVVQAARFFDRETNGLAQAWAGRVWMNPPYERKTCGAFVDKLCEEIIEGSVSEACVLLNNITETLFFQRLAEVAAGMSFPFGSACS